MLRFLLCCLIVLSIPTFLWLDHRVDYRGLTRWRILAVTCLVGLAGLLWPVFWLLVGYVRLKARNRRRASHS